MMRAIIFAAIGFWISRKIYENYDQRRRQEIVKIMERRIGNILLEDGWTDEEIRIAQDEILADYE